MKLHTDFMILILEQGSTWQPEITADFMILILETVRRKGNTMRILPHQSGVHFFKHHLKNVIIWWNEENLLVNIKI